jgi:hypothetical protein
MYIRTLVSLSQSILLQEEPSPDTDIPVQDSCYYGGPCVGSTDFPWVVVVLFIIGILVFAYKFQKKLNEESEMEMKKWTYDEDSPFKWDDSHSVSWSDDGLDSSRSD